MFVPSYNIEELKRGASSFACAHHIRKLSSVDYEALIIDLAYGRLNRKAGDIINIFNTSGGKDWNETFHIMLLTVLGGMDNRQAMTELSRRVKSHMVMRENSSIVNLEALLLGSAGLLDIYPEDDYIHRLRLEFEHLATKYNITPMLAGDWNLSSYYRHNHPTLRLTQLAACLHNKEFTIHRALDCRSRKDVYDLFSGETSQYWADYYIPNLEPSSTNTRMGQMKSDLLGINLIAPMIYSYGTYTHNEEMTAAATELLESIAPEFNRLTKPWFSAGVEPRNAFISQAIIQLSKEFCTPRRCESCPLARRLTTL